MTQSMWFLLAAVAIALTAFAAAWLWRSLALRHGWVDWPDARRLHQTPTPRGGGIGIVLVLLGAIAVAPWDPARLVLAGLALVVAGGLWDDLRPLPALPKLLFQATGAALPALAMPLFPAILGPALSMVLAWLLTLALVNIWNFMDGSNGLAASQGALIGATAVILGLLGMPGWVPVLGLALALAAGCLGFLPLNLPRARVFLGDVGSQAIGFALAVLALVVCSQPDGRALWALWLPPSAFLLDAGLTLAGRMSRREKVWHGHRQHLYQRAVAAGWSHSGVCAAYAAWTVVASALSAVLLVTGTMHAPAVVLAVYTAGMLLYVSRTRHWPRPAQ